MTMTHIPSANADFKPPPYECLPAANENESAVLLDGRFFEGLPGFSETQPPPSQKESIHAAIRREEEDYQQQLRIFQLISPEAKTALARRSEDEYCSEEAIEIALDHQPPLSFYGRERGLLPKYHDKLPPEMQKNAEAAWEEERDRVATWGSARYFSDWFPVILETIDDAAATSAAASNTLPAEFYHTLMKGARPGHDEKIPFSSAQRAAWMLESLLMHPEAYRKAKARIKAIERTPAAGIMLADEDQIRKLAKEIAQGYRSLHTATQRRLTPDSLRLRCDRHWRRQLRKRITESIAQAARVLGHVGGRQQFCSDHEVRLWKQRQETGDSWTKSQHVWSPRRQKVVCSVEEAKKAAEKTRYATLIAIANGMTERAKRDGQKCYFITMTLPPEHHPNPTRGHNNYNEIITLKESQSELQHRWQRARAIFAKHSARPYGIWTVEPHRDGCPHRHAILFCKESEAEDIRNALMRQFPGGRVALDFKEIEERQDAKVSSYILTYLLKAANHRSGQGIGGDEEDHFAHFSRYRAWKASNRFRGYGFFGVQPGTMNLWRRLYNADSKALRRDERKIQRAMRKRQYATALALMGVLKPKDKQHYRFTYQEKANSYKEVYKIAVGIRSVDSNFRYHWKTEDYMLINSKDLDDLTGGRVTVSGSLPRGAAARPPGRERPPGSGPSSAQ